MNKVICNHSQEDVSIQDKFLLKSKVGKVICSFLNFSLPLVTFMTET